MADISQIKLPNGDTYNLVDETSGFVTSDLVATNWVNGSQTGSVRTTGSMAENSSYTIGSYATAEGSGTKAIGEASHAEGGGTTANGSHSHAEGAGTTASGVQSHAEGVTTQAIGAQSHAEGASTVANGSQSHAEGASTTAGANFSHAEGNSTTASGLYSHAEGYQTIARGEAAHAEGAAAKAYSSYSHAEGMNTEAYGRSQHVFGENNIVDSAQSSTNRATYVEIVGNGTNSSNLHNARTLDWSGNEWLAGKLTIGANPTAAMDVVTKQYMENQGYLTLSTLPIYDGTVE